MYIFFLGGYDAEMYEIRRILESKSVSFFDKKLSWGAKASDYETELTGLTDQIPVLVELAIDLDLPQKAVIINHHGERAGEATSIEQVADLTGNKLDRWQELIAANDRGWIPGLIEAGATKEEIQKVREFDRHCQGVTDPEEKTAEESVRNVRIVSGIAIVEFPHKHTSPVVDRLYGKYRNILIYTPDSTNFSGDGNIVLKLAKKYPDGWYGGDLPKRGFWGTSMRIEQKEITELL